MSGDGLKTITVLTSAGLLAFTLAGCAAISGSGSTKSISVTVSERGVIHVGGNTVAMSSLAGKLKSAGCGPETRIRIMVPRGTSREFMSEMTRRLASAGFKRIIFAFPRKSTVSIGRQK
ncbi:MAG: hypothetical protein R6V03_08200 [Kiritimatiellia bacterium]